MKQNGREKCEIFAKRFFLFAGNPIVAMYVHSIAQLIKASSLKKETPNHISLWFRKFKTMPKKGRKM